MLERPKLLNKKNFKQYGGGVISETHGTDPRGQDHPAPLDEKDRLVANHVLNVHVEPVATCK